MNKKVVGIILGVALIIIALLVMRCSHYSTQTQDTVNPHQKKLHNSTQNENNIEYKINDNDNNDTEKQLLHEAQDKKNESDSHSLDSMTTSNLMVQQHSSLDSNEYHQQTKTKDQNSLIKQSSQSHANSTKNIIPQNQIAKNNLISQSQPSHVATSSQKEKSSTTHTPIKKTDSNTTIAKHPVHTPNTTKTDKQSVLTQHNDTISQSNTAKQYVTQNIQNITSQSTNNKSSAIETKHNKLHDRHDDSQHLAQIKGSSSDSHMKSIESTQKYTKNDKNDTNKYKNNNSQKHVQSLQQHQYTDNRTQHNKNPQSNTLNSNILQQNESTRIKNNNVTNNNQCTIAPNCNNMTITRSLAAASLQFHAKVRAQEESIARGNKAGNNFMNLWKETRNIVLPKLTSHVSNIREYALSNDRQVRTCAANYYTEVLEDFGNGWRDKKGDTSPIYSVVYRISCKNMKPTIGIVEESIHQSNRDYESFHKEMRQVQLQVKRDPPLCDTPEVYQQITQASFAFHAKMRAQEEGRKYGKQAEEKFINLWQDTQSKVIAKLTSHISNIQNQSIDSKKRFRTCAANYYTEVLEDFGNGWRDKKGDTSPRYIIYYNVAYHNDDDDSIAVRITTQNRIKR